MEKRNFLIAFILLFAMCGIQSAKASYDLIPLPQKVDLKVGKPFFFNSNTTIVFPANRESLKKVAGFLADYLKESTGLLLSVSDKIRTKNVIVLKSDYQNQNKEAYKISVSEHVIEINGASDAGTFYGVQTLRKSVAGCGDVLKKSLPQAEITDFPRFSYRGMHLDVARHFFSVEFVKTYLDILALHNINTFHWHLTDDQGWRIEIKKYPKLTEIGSQRKGTAIAKTLILDGKPYGGFYTQDQIKEIVAYARDRFITVVPEIDMPGHMNAALAAYPELGCTGDPYEVNGNWGVFPDVLCAGNPKTYEFLKDVFTELTELFPSEYIHIGGDECPKIRWKECPKCQAKINELGLVADSSHTAEQKLQSYCTTCVETYLSEKGRRIIGWDEILEGGLAPGATVMSWRGMNGGIEAAKLGHQVIMSPYGYAYFDYYQSENTEKEPMAFGGYLPLERVYSFDPVPEQLTEDQKKFIIGNQANLWTEFIPTNEQAEYMLMPRIDALSETQWTMPDKKDYQNFLTRLPFMLKLYEKLGYNYSKSGYSVN